MQQYVFAYDIQQASARRRALKILRSYADCYQDSVFDLRLNKQEYQEVVGQLQDLIDSGDLLLAIKIATNVKSWQLGSGLQPLTRMSLVVA